MKVSVIIPTRNEESNLSNLIHYIRSTSTLYPSEIIVADGKSSDGTVTISESLADKTITRMVPCRASQMHAGADLATGSLLLFLHVDTQLPHNWQSILKQAWDKDPRLVATAFKISFDHSGFTYRIISFCANFRTRWLTGVPHGDQAIAVLPHAYHQSGGFPDVPIMEEYYLVNRLKKRGRIQLLSQKVKTSARRYEKKRTDQK